MFTILEFARFASAWRTHRGRLMRTLCVLCLGAALGRPAAAQNPAAPRLWAAQTGVDLVTLSWDAVPGTKEYRIYLGDPSSPATFKGRPASVLGSNSRSARVPGVQRVVNGITLVAVAADGSVLHQAQFNPVVPVTSFLPAEAPAAATAQATSATEVTLSWDPVPGATAYFIGRAAHKSGFAVLCALCPTAPSYVDRNVASGLPHTYVVAAIFPAGVSTRVKSNTVTPGAPTLATTAPAQATPPAAASTATPTTATAPVPTTATSSASVSTGSSTATTTSTTMASQPSPVPSTGGTLTKQSGSGSSGGAAAPPSVTATVVAPGVTVVSWQPSTTTVLTGYTVKRHVNFLSGAYGTAVLATVSPTVQSYTDRSALGGGAVSARYEIIATATAGSASTFSNDILLQAPAPNPVAPPTAVTATVTGWPGVTVTWQPSTTTGVTGYTVHRSVNGGAPEVRVPNPSPLLVYGDQNFPASYFAGGPARVTYTVIAHAAGGSQGATSNEVVVPPPANAPAPAPAPVAPCRLDYQRADNMWAPFGQPSGQLGTEFISLQPGQSTLFITDWAWEKNRNNGSAYYGSHLRIATNPTSRTIRLHLRSWTLTGLVVFARTGNDTFWIRLDPNTTRQFQADLMEVLCE